MPPRERLRLALEQPPGADRDRSLVEIAWSVIDDDPQLAGEVIGQLPGDNTDRLRLLQHLAIRLAEDDPQSATVWAAGLESETDKSVAIGRIAVVVAEQDPEKAANLLSESGVAGRNFEVSVVEVLQRWSATDAAASMRWVEQFPAGRFRGESIRTVFARWFGMDAPAAAAWLGAIRDASLRQEAGQAVAEVVAGMDPPTLDKALERLDPEARSRIRSVSPAAK